MVIATVIERLPQMPQQFIGLLVAQLGVEFVQIRSPTAHREAETAKAHRG